MPLSQIISNYTGDVYTAPETPKESEVHWPGEDWAADYSPVDKKGGSVSPPLQSRVESQMN